MDIAYFINNRIPPEIKSLILQYTLSTPIKEELLEFSEKRKNIEYKWFDLDFDYFHSVGVFPEWIRTFSIGKKRRGETFKNCTVKFVDDYDLIEETLGKQSILWGRSRIGIIPYIKPGTR